MLQQAGEAHPVREPATDVARFTNLASAPTGSPPLKPAPAQLAEHRTGADEVKIWLPVLRLLGLSRSTIETILHRCQRHRTRFVDELLAGGFVSEHSFYAAVAEVLKLPAHREIDPAVLLLHEAQAADLLHGGRGPALVRIETGDSGAGYVVAPDAEEFSRLSATLASRPALRGRLAVTSPSALRRSVLARCSQILYRRAVSGLADALPYCSARTTFTAVQAFVCGTALTAAVVVAIVWPAPALLVMHIALICFFVPCVLLRLAASWWPIRRVPEVRAGPPAEMPRYSVLVALHREAEVVPQLLVALGRIEWPRAKLEVKIVCEADDTETLAALRAQRLRPYVEVIEVPPGEPRTKPKALAYALQLVSGDFVALYDAEDRPHPRQLIEAWNRFRDAGPDLACLQAPLVVSNRAASVVSRMFAFEYAGLFRVLLPFLSRNALVLPLGGTSNHFRRSVLEKIGGWDPYNVTEDADLGLRLRRFGYRTETITLPTLEAGPLKLGVWIPQRTRWFKGWAQTWLVHMRDPRRLASELGPASFVVSQILFAGMLLSALSHPLLLVTGLIILAEAALGETIGLYHRFLLTVDIALVSLGYLAFLAIGARSLPAADRIKLPIVALVTPVYWLMLSFAAWRAVFQLLRNPHHWEKTPHGDAIGTDTPAAPRRLSVRRGTPVPI